MNKAIAALLLATVLFGCRTTEQFNADLDEWVGHSVHELIASWGPPTRAYKSGGREYLTWVEAGSVTIPGSPPTYQTTVYGNTAYTTTYGGTSPTTVDLSCEVTMIIVNEAVSSWQYKGNNCN
tara:strand:- start:181 stop:549 length:369 start_codon:yes stop_codon:yes gene_type:complete